MATLGEILRWCIISVSQFYGRIRAWLLRRDRLVIASENKFRALVEHAPDAIVIVDWHGHVQLVNAKAERLFGYTAAEIIGQNLTDLVPERHRSAHRSHMKRFMGEASARFMGEGLELSGLRKDGSEFPVEISLGPLETDQGLLVSCVVRDITSRKAIEVELRTRAEALERSNAELERFANVASHDLSAPLHSIEGFTALLHKRYHDTLGDDGKDFIDQTLAAARRMRTLIDDLLRYSKVSADPAPFKAVDLAEATQEALALLAAPIAAANGRITTGELPTVLGDQGRIVQLLQNLIGNGIKFSQAEVPTVDISAERGDEATWRISVRDNGIGIDPAAGERIFEMFERLHSVGKFEGTGIGLAICKRIVEQHGGEIAAVSANGGGTVFSFTLPDGRNPTSR